MLSSQLAAADVHLTVTTPGRAPRGLAEVPASIEVVLPEQLQALPGATLDEKLAALIPGLTTTRSAGDLSDRTAALTMRGLGSSPQGGRSQGRTLVLLDGVPLNNSATGGVNWNDLEAETIERIEVFKGPASSLYGSSALGGIINVVTKGAQKGGSLETAYGTYNTFDAAARAGAQSGPLSVQVLGRRLHTDGYVQELPLNVTAASRGGYATERSVGAKAAYDLGGLGSVRADLSRYNGTTGLGTNYHGTAKGEYRESGTELLRAAWSGSREALDWSVSFFSQRTEQTRVEGTSASRTDIAVDRMDRGVLSCVSGQVLGLVATLGFDWKHGSVDGYDDYNNGKYARDMGETDSYAPFLQLETKLLSERLNLSAGLRYDTVKFHDGYSENTNSPSLSAGGLDRHTWTSLSPKLSAGYRYGDKVSQYVSYARGFRTGELEDMTLTLIKGTWYQKPNPELGPERADTYETGFKLNPAAGLYLDPSVYYTDARDFIYRVRTGVQAGARWEQIYANMGKVEIYGLELPVKYIAGALTLSGSYTLSRSRVLSAAQVASGSSLTRISGRRLTYAPELIYTAGAAWDCGDARFFANWTHKGKQYADDANTLPVSGYSVASLGIVRQLGSGLSLSLRFGNIFNERFQQSGDELAPGRTATTALKAVF